MKDRQAEKMVKREQKLKELGINLDLSQLVNTTTSLTFFADIKTWI